MRARRSAALGTTKLFLRGPYGQRNRNTRADLEAYPKFAEWKTQYERFNAFGIFSNQASRYWGLDPLS